MIRVCDYIADFIYNQGIFHVFMLSGGGSIYLDDGVFCHKHLKYIGVRNEATAPMMAEAYARITQNIGAVYVTTGPGGANAVAGLAEAWVDSAPIIVISGQVEKKYTTYNSGLKGIRTIGCQELNIIEVVKSITKYSIMVNDPNSIKYHLEKAVYYALNGRKGPVWLDIPLDVQSAIIDDKNIYGFIPENNILEIKNKDIEKTICLLKKSIKPLIVIGQGIRQADAIQNLKTFINRLKIPVISSRLGQDILPFSNNYNCGHGGTNGTETTKFIMKEADLIISIGSRLSIPFVGMNLNAFSNNVKIIVVDIEKNELLKNGVHIDIPIHGCAKNFIEKLNNKLNSFNDLIILPDYSKWMEKCRNKKDKKSLVDFDKKSNPIDLYYFVSRLDKLSTAKNIFVSSAGSSYFVTGQSLSFNKGQREITSGAFASMGVGLPLAIGSYISDQNSQILVITGDGSIELNIQELKTISQYNMNIKVFVINNGGYVSIRNAQDNLFNGRYINSKQINDNNILDFSKVADTFGLKYHIIDDYKIIDEKIEEVMGYNGPSLIEVICDNKQKIFSYY